MSQSPIKLAAENPRNFVDALPLAKPRKLLKVQYPEQGSFSGEFENSPHGNLVLDPSSPRPTIRFRGITYDLRMIHIHTGSEHVVEEDDPHDMEVHLVHAPQGSPVNSPLVVIGILFNRPDGKNSGVHAGGQIYSIGKGWITSGKKSKEQGVSGLNPLAFFPLKNVKADTENWFHYEGSLTGYPYSENVSWFVMRDVGSVDSKTFKALEDHAEHHQRPLQPLDRRLVVRSFQ